MKEKIGMEKLVELLREYNMSNKSPYILGDADYYVDGGLYAPQIISKNRGFIEWLVENDHIDFEGKLNTLRFEGLVNQTLDSSLALYMLLSIQDEPIEFLISILK